MFTLHFQHIRTLENRIICHVIYVVAGSHHGQLISLIERKAMWAFVTLVSQKLDYISLGVTAYPVHIHVRPSSSFNQVLAGMQGVWHIYMQNMGHDNSP